MTGEKYPPDPDRLPYVGPDELRDIRLRGMSSNYYQRIKQDETRGFSDFVIRHNAAIRYIRGSTWMQLGEPEGVCSGIATMPIDVLAEPIEQVVASVASIGESADRIDRPLRHISWLNFIADHRREQGKISQAKKKSEDMKAAIQDALNGHNVISNVALDLLPHGTTIAGIRQRMLLGALGLVVWDAGVPVAVGGAPITAPYLSLDADTTITDDALVIADEPLRLNKALFVSGNLQYVGGIMDKDIEAIRQEPKEMQLLYVVEHMRRRMLHSLPPVKQRGYLPETGMITTLSTLANLGGYNVHAQNNESYWLEVAAEEATRASRGYVYASRTTPTAQEKRAERAIFTSYFFGQTLESITRYEDYFINTSIEGVEKSVRKYGAAAVVAFDQGAAYTMRTQIDRALLSDAYDRGFLPDHLIMNAAYSYYKHCGGELTMEGLLSMNELINNLQLVKSSELIPGRLAWTPQYIAKEEWPTAP